MDVFEALDGTSRSSRSCNRRFRFDDEEEMDPRRHPQVDSGASQCGLEDHSNTAARLSTNIYVTHERHLLKGKTKNMIYRDFKPCSYMVKHH